MKEKLSIIIIIALCSITGMVYASSVITTDGKNFNVTNDIGVSATYTMNQICVQVNQSSATASRDDQTLLKDSEVAYTWAAVQQMALNAEQTYANQVNGS